MILVEPIKLETAGTDILALLTEVPVNEILQGNDCGGNAATLFGEGGFRFRNILNRAFIVIKNNHDYLNANIRVITSKEYDTLKVVDMDKSIAPGKTKFYGPFSDIFQGAGSITVQSLQNLPVTQTYQDFIICYLSHDSSDVVGMIEIGVFYV
jgi:hypothetical protein